MPTPSPIRLSSGQVVFRVQYRLVPGGTPTSDRFDRYEDALAFCELIDRVGGQVARQIRDAATRAPHALTCAQAFEEYCLHVASYAEDGTVHKYRRVWASHIGPTFDSWPIPQVSRQMVESWVADLRRTETAASVRARARDPQLMEDFLSVKTIKNTQGLLSSVLGLQVERGTLDSNPARGVRLPAPHRKRAAVFLSKAQRDALVEATAPEWRPFVTLLLSTGLRWAEATALRPEDLDLDSDPATVRVERAWKRTGSGWRLGPPKTSRSRRTVSLPRTGLVEDLRALADGAVPGGLVFRGPGGDRVRATWFHARVWAPAIERAGLRERPRVHDLRHTHASMLLGAGVPIHIVQARLGHESIQTTVGVYGHLVPDAGLIAAAAVAEAL